MKKLHSLLLFTLLSVLSLSQTPLVDPLVNIKSFSTFDMGLYGHSPNIDNVDFGDYELTQGLYSSTIHSALFVHHVIKIDNEPIFKTKTGLLINSYYTNFKNNQAEEFYLSQGELALSFLIGTHLPMKYNSSKDKFFKSVDLNIGLYMGTPWVEYFADEAEKYDGKAHYFGFDYVKFGIIAEIEYSLINKEGYGHRIGLRSMTDFNKIWKFENNKTGIYPCFFSLGIYYNFWTTEVAKRK